MSFPILASDILRLIAVLKNISNNYFIVNSLKHSWILEQSFLFSDVLDMAWMYLQIKTMNYFIVL